MALRERDVRIQRPCPVKLDPSRGRNGERSWYCDHCSKSVHVLSNMTEDEARAFLRANVGQDLCVTYAVRKDGSVRFRQPAPPADIVPLAAVRRRGARIAAGLGLALAACTPHEHPDVRSKVEVADANVETTPCGPTIPEVEPDPDELLVDGMIEPDFEPMKPGGIRVEPLPPENVEPKISAQPLPRRGSIRRVRITED